MYFILFVLGVALGSFLNVLTLRYDPEKKFSFRSIQGRSRCMSCGKQLRWYELIPLISFCIQRGMCRSCKTSLSRQYPIIELLMGVIAVGIGYIFFHIFSFPLAIVLWAPYVATLFWIIVSMVLLFALIIDAKHFIIPNGTNMLLFGFGIVWTAFLALWGFNEDMAHGSFLTHFAQLIEPWQGIILNHLIGMGVAGIFFLLIVVMSRGKGMGVGDIKLIGSLGLLFGWPDIAIIIISSFIIGTIAIVPSLILRQKHGSDKVPFGPFIVMASFLVLFWGTGLLQAYFDIIGKLSL